MKCFWKVFIAVHDETRFHYAFNGARSVPVIGLNANLVYGQVNRQNWGSPSLFSSFTVKIQSPLNPVKEEHVKEVILPSIIVRPVRCSRTVNVSCWSAAPVTTTYHAKGSKIQKNWCTVTVAPTIGHHVGHSRTPANQSWDQVSGRSQRLLLG